MRNRNLQNEKLDRTGRRLLEVAAGREREADIEKIILAPHLFDSVKARIKAQEEAKQRKGFFRPPVWNWQSATAGLAVLLIVFIAGLAFVFSNRDSITTTVQRMDEPKTETHNQETQPQPVASPENLPVPAKIKYPERKARPTEKVAAKTNAAKKTELTAPRKKNLEKHKTQPVENFAGEFYALTSTGNLDDAAELKIVRTELSRASLFALGVNLPIENETEKFKTDLLIGSDGVARAIRFVK